MKYCYTTGSWWVVCHELICGVRAAHRQLISEYRELFPGKSFSDIGKSSISRYRELISVPCIGKSLWRNPNCALALLYWWRVRPNGPLALPPVSLMGQSPHRISAGGSLLFMRCVSLTLTGLVSAWRRGEASSAILAKPLSDYVSVFRLRQCKLRHLNVCEILKKYMLFSNKLNILHS